MQNFIYPVNLIPDEQDGGYVVMFPDIPEAITQGENIKDALNEAIDCLEEAIASRIVTSQKIPSPSPKSQFRYTVPVPAGMAAKAALYIAMKEAGITNVELAKRLNCDEKEVRRLLSPKHKSKIPRINEALFALGKQLVLSMKAA